MYIFSLIKRAFSSLLVVSVVACTGGSHIKPHSATSQDGFQGESQIDAEDIELIHKLEQQSEAFHLALKKRGLLYSDKASNTYITDLGQRLTPAFMVGDKGLRFYILKEATANAMALPNGNIYINIGLLSAVETEGQLAAILAHEIGHVVHRHGLKSALNRQETALTANIVDIFLLGTGLGYLPAMGSLASFSREQEKEADLAGLKYLNVPGYALNQAPEVFKIFQNLPEMMTIEHSAYSSHPDNQERVAYLEKIIKERYPGGTNEYRESKPFDQMRRKVVESNVQIRLLHNQYKMALLTLEQAESYYKKSPLIQYYRGEANRLIAEYPKKAAAEITWLNKGEVTGSDEDFFIKNKARYAKKAKSFYQQALKSNPDLLLAYKGMGLMDYSNRQYANAIKNFNRYMNTEKTPEDSLYIKRLIRNGERKLNATE